MISKEIRKLIISARDDGKSVVEIMHIFQVKQTAVYSLYKLVNETGSVEPRPNKRGRKPALNENQLKELEQLIIDNSDITLEEIKEKMNLKICISAISRIIKNKLHYNYKKKLYIQKNSYEKMLKSNEKIGLKIKKI